MPSLKNLTCSLELCDPQQTLQEYGTTYGDGFVETFVAVPSAPRKFAVHFASTAYIADGLAMYVFIDGEYQCNRNRGGLKDRKASHKPLSRRTLVDFLVRQKEERQKNGGMIAREWRFEKLNIVSADQAPQECSPNVLENIGCIEIVVLRCKPNRAKPSNMSFDGPADSPDGYLSLDGHPKEWGYDDRSLPQQHPGDDSRGRWKVQYIPPGYEEPPSLRRASSRGIISRPPSIMELHPPRSQRSYSRHPTPHVITNVKIPPGAVQYGSGPVPHTNKAESVRELFENRTPRHIPGNDLVPSHIMKQIADDAYRQGAEAERRKKEMEAATQPRPAWSSPYQGPGAPTPWDVTAVEQDRRSNINTHIARPPSSRGSTNGNVWPASDNGDAWAQQSKTGEWGQANGSDSGSWTESTNGTKDTSNQHSGRSHSKPSDSSNKRGSNGWSADPSASIPQYGTQNPSSRDKTASRSRKSVSVHNMPEGSVVWDNGWNGGEESDSDSTITSARVALARAQGEPQHSRNGTHRNPESDWGPQASSNAAPQDSSSITSSYSSMSYNGFERKLYNKTPPAPAHPVPHRDGRPRTPPPPYMALPNIFRLGSKSNHTGSGSHSASRDSTKIDESPLALPQGHKLTSSPKVSTWDSGKSKSQSKHTSQSKRGSMNAPWTMNGGTSGNNDGSNGWGATSGSRTMPGSWEPPTPDVATSGRDNGATNNQDSGGWGANSGANEQNGSVSVSWGTEQVDSNNQPDQGKAAPDAWNNGAWSGDNKDTVDGKVGEVTGWDNNDQAANDSWNNNDPSGNADNSGEITWDTNNADSNEQINDSGDLWGAQNDWNPDGDAGDNKDASSQKDAPADDWQNQDTNQNDTSGGNDAWGATWGNSDDKQQDDPNDTPGEAAADTKNDEQNAKNDSSDLWANPDNTQDTQNDTSGDINWGDNNDTNEQPAQNDTSGGGGWGDTWGAPNNDAPTPSANDKKSSSSHKSRHSSRRTRTHKLTTNPQWIFPQRPASNILYPIPEDPSNIPILTNGKDEKIWTFPAEPVLAVPEDKARDEGLEYQVHPGMGMPYTHAVNRPEYIDSLSEPYAVFRFKYRTRGYLQNLLGSEEVPDGEGGPRTNAHGGKGIDTASVIKERIHGLSEDELVAEIMRLQAVKLAVDGNGGWGGNGNGNGNVEKAPTHVVNWVDEQKERSRRNSLKSVSKHGSNKGSDKAADAGDGGWGDAWGGAPAGSAQGSKKSSSKVESDKSANAGGDPWGGDAWGGAPAGSAQGSKNSGSIRSSKEDDSGGFGNDWTEQKQDDNAGADWEVVDSAPDAKASGGGGGGDWTGNDGPAGGNW